MSGTWPDRRQRHAVRLEAVVTRDSGEAVTAKVSDLSLDGCCLSGNFLIGERVEVDITGVGKLSAEIRWAFVGRAGARFTSSTSADPKV